MPDKARDKPEPSRFADLRLYTLAELADAWGVGEDIVRKEVNEGRVLTMTFPAGPRISADQFDDAVRRGPPEPESEQ